MEETDMIAPEAHGAPETPAPDAPVFDAAAELAALRAEVAQLRSRWEGFAAGAAVSIRGDVTPAPAGGAPEPVFGAAQLRGMTPEQINARWDDIRRSMGRRQ